MDIRKIDLNLLRALDALIAERNVSRAAQRLHLSQPATSALLARLRELLDDPLLVRSGRGMAPTDRALALAEPVRRVLDDIADILQPGGDFQPRQSTRTFRFAATEYAGNTAMPKLSALLAETGPGIRAALLPPNLERLVAQMESGEIDLAALNETFVPPQLRSTLLFRDDFCVIARHGHPDIRKRISLNAFCNAVHLQVSPRGGGFSAGTDEVLARLGRKRFVKLSLPHFTLAVDMVAQSDMIAVFPRRLAALAADRVQVLKPPIDVPPVTMRLCWHERAERDPAHQWFRARVLDSVA